MDPTFRIATYNIRSFPWFTVPVKEIVEWITHSADIVALQEVWTRHSQIAAAFAARGWVFLRPQRESQIAGFFGSGLAIAWRADRWSVTDSRFYPYLSAVGFDALVVKGWFRVELCDRQGNHLRLINTHMQSDYEICDELWRPIAEPVRMAQAVQMMDTNARLPHVPTLIVGDMNTEMCWFGRRCGWLTHHCGPTFEGTSQVLDHCAALQRDKWRLIGHRVGRECGEWSDHWPVIWHLGWPAPAGQKIIK
jgi:endonuclease/exonuclease/phosphatase family metal-dependent hydrolase